jgi:L-seryl-tRNA(Ser) seleniumtransferase
MSALPADGRRAIPSLDVLLRHPALQAAAEQHGRSRVTATARDLLAQLRSSWASLPQPPDADALAQACEERLAQSARPSLRRVFNLTGTVIHTNLGRAPLPRCAIDAVAQAMTDPVNLEYDLEEGARGERDSHIETLLARLTGAEAALAVNNNAAAVFLVLNTLGQGREVPVSRGELVEIGGSFRVPDIMKRSGVQLVEVGTTNRTHLKDYEAAIGPQTAALMKVHTSNYSIQGFTASVPEAQLAQLARERGLPLVSDLGSGTLVDLAAFGLPREPTPREMLAAGVDLVTFSGDKLLGGPQAGLVVGREDLVERLRRNPLKRALRLDKMTLAALEAVLRLYEAPERLTRELPVLRLLTRPQAAIRGQAERLQPRVRAALPATCEVDVAEVQSQIGSGSLPVDLLPSCAIRVRVPGKAGTTHAGAIAAAFRALPTPVIGRVHDGEFLLDLRCLDDEDGFAAQLGALRLELPA